MLNHQIIFTEKNTAALLEIAYRQPAPHEVVVETVYSTISIGTEKANITGIVTSNTFPVKNMGYSSAGFVIAIGDAVEGIAVGDRVVVYWGTHAKYNTVSEQQVVKIEDSSISLQEAALSFIATFSLAAIRKTRLEIGEAAIVIGLGLLGQLAIKLLRANGATPIIAVDPVESRRNDALVCGADYALDPFQDNFANTVKSITNGGAKIAIEVTGVGAGLDCALDCMAKFGRVALLGCTRDSNFNIDYYRKIHCPGIVLVGAHTSARPNIESHPGYFTHRDDIQTILKLCASQRLSLIDIVKKTCAPQDCPAVYSKLVHSREFPVGVQFDWRLLQ